MESWKGIACGVMGFYICGILFVPIGLVCTFLAFWRGQIVGGLISLTINILAALVSPALLILLVGIYEGTR